MDFQLPFMSTIIKYQYSMVNHFSVGEQEYWNNPHVYRADFVQAPWPWRRLLDVCLISSGGSPWVTLYKRESHF